MQTQTEKLTEAQKLAKKEAEEQQLLAKIIEQRQKSVGSFFKKGAKVILCLTFSLHSLLLLPFFSIVIGPSWCYRAATLVGKGKAK